MTLFELEYCFGITIFHFFRIIFVCECRVSSYALVRIYGLIGTLRLLVIRGDAAFNDSSDRMHIAYRRVDSLIY